MQDTPPGDAMGTIEDRTNDSVTMDLSNTSNETIPALKVDRVTTEFRCRWKSSAWDITYIH